MNGSHRSAGSRDARAASPWRSEALIDAVASLGGVAFLVWLGVAWADRQFDSAVAGLLFSGFFLALAAGCLLRCLGSVRRLSGQGGS
jgi:hypothetical protein